MLDDLQNAEEHLELAQEAVGNPNRNQLSLIQAYREIINLRRRISADSLRISPRAFEELIEGWDAMISKMNLDQQFIDFQKFKIFSEASRLAKGRGMVNAKMICIQKALNALKERSSLTGYNDLVRLQRIKDFLMGEVNFADPEIVEIARVNLRKESYRPTTNKHEYRLYANEADIYHIAIDQSLFQAGDLAAYFIKSSRRLPGLTIGSNYVIVEDRNIAERQKPAVENDVKDIVKGKIVRME